MKTKLPNPKKKQNKINLDSLPQIEPNAAGLDIGHRQHWCAVPSDRCEKPVRSFNTFTEDLEKMDFKLLGSLPLRNLPPG